MSWLSLNSLPTSLIPSMSGPLTISSGLYFSRARLRLSINPSFEPSTTRRARRCSTVRWSWSASSLGGAFSFLRNSSVRRSTASFRLAKIRSSASSRSSSGIEAYRDMRSLFTMAKSRPAFVQ